MSCFTIYQNSFDNQAFRATGKQFIGGHSDTFTLQGHTGPEIDGAIDVDFEMEYASGSKSMFFSCEIEVATGAVQGSWTFADDSLGGDFVLKRSSSHLRFRPAPAVIQKSPARALWEFALTAVRHDVKKTMLSRSYFLEKCQERKRYIEMAKDLTLHDRAASPAASAELAEMNRKLVPEDVQFYASIIQYNLNSKSTPVHRYLSLFFYHFHVSYQCQEYKLCQLRKFPTGSSNHLYGLHGQDYHRPMWRNILLDHENQRRKTQRPAGNTPTNTRHLQNTNSPSREISRHGRATSYESFNGGSQGV